MSSEGKDEKKEKKELSLREIWTCAMSMDKKYLQYNIKQLIETSILSEKESKLTGLIHFYDVLEMCESYEDMNSFFESLNLYEEMYQNLSLPREIINLIYCTSWSDPMIEFVSNMKDWSRALYILRSWSPSVIEKGKVFQLLIRLSTAIPDSILDILADGFPACLDNIGTVFKYAVKNNHVNVLRYYFENKRADICTDAYLEKKEITTCTWNNEGRDT